MPLDFLITKCGIGLHLLPILVCILSLVAVTTCYFLSLTQDHISPYFPYISDAGSKIPESCIFGQLLNIISVLAGLCFYSWHKHLLDPSHKFNQRCYRQIKLARIALCFGFICAFGMSVVANFQETAVWSMHLFGAGLLFGGGSIYALIVTYITYKYIVRSRIWIARLVLAFISLFSFILQPTTGLIARFMYDGDNIRKWKPTDKGYSYHVVSSIMEWITALSFICFIFTLVWELKDYKVHNVKIVRRWSMIHIDNSHDNDDDQNVLS
ncbi:DNA damage-regulated autophagy modulator protein isoform 2 [Schistosoma japonicum]|uniref:DNA damage-regulated autophagy modulator protein isoform 2 n=1 Tax=Schistosoma japonicum TaxID=6182 RepID=Q5DAX3_SCHJA|nr:SJCHGC02197 protein [Schistosoma japonicum]KAH8853133.1 DNA damage-regulated autophagy modulator protein 2 [Schistosoma japonicum]TNN17299.1 DNA damage-regulated autophagy modulator protein isoform 2 [Schistosoma japonicum]